MTRKEASEKWQIIKAYGEGKTIQEKHVGSSTDVWTDMHEMEELDLNDSYWEYRIKPEENYTIEQNAGENRIEGGVVGISGSVEKQHRPFKDCNELIEYYQKKYESAVGCDIYFPSLYKPCIWVKSIEYGTENLITAYDNDEESIGGSCVFIQDIWVDMKELFDNFTFLDGSPCGLEE